MRRINIWMACSAVFLFVGVVPAQSRLSIRAACIEPVEGWQTMQVEHCRDERCTVWVSPTAAITENDIERAQLEVRDDAFRAIKVVFTDAGVKKMRDLSATQLNKLLALVVDDRVVWTPTVAGILKPGAKNFMLTGSTPQGLTEEEVQRIMTILPPGQVSFGIKGTLRPGQPH